MSHRAYVAHRLPGRIRISLPHAKRNTRALNAVKDVICSMPGVRTVELSPVAGSVLVHYDRSHAPGFETQMRQLGAATGAFTLHTPEVGELEESLNAIEQDAEWLAGHSAVARAIVDGVAALNQDVKQATNGAVDLKVLLPLSLAFYSFIHRKSDLSTPLWVTLGLFSFNSFVALHHSPAAAPAPVAGAAEPDRAAEREPQHEPRRRSGRRADASKSTR